MLRRPVAASGERTRSGGISPPPLAIKLNAIALPQILLSAPVAGAEAELTATGVRAAHARTRFRCRAHRRPSGPRRLARRQSSPRAAGERADRRRQAQGAAGRARRGAPRAARPAVGRGHALRHRPARRLARDDRGRGRRHAACSPAACRSRARDDAYRVAAELRRRFETIVPRTMRCFLPATAGSPSISPAPTTARSRSSSATLRSEGVDLSASGVLGPDLVPRSADLSLKLGQAGRAALPFVPGDISVATLTADVGLDAGRGRAVEGDRSRRTASRAPSAASTASPSTRRGRRGTWRGRTRARRASASTASAEGVVPSDLALRDALGPTFKATRRGLMVGRAAGRVREPRRRPDRRDGEFLRHCDRQRASAATSRRARSISRASRASRGAALGGRAELKAKRHRGVQTARSI